MRTSTGLLLGLYVVTGVVACGEKSDGAPGTGDALPQCHASGYVAFDPANHHSQDIRVGVYTQMTELMNEAKSDWTLAADRFTQAKDLYTDLAGSAGFRDKVQGRGDDHLDGSPRQGNRIDATIMEWLDAGIGATSNLTANVAKQRVDKTLTEFFFLSVYHEMVLGSRQHWDEAFGYYGSKASNDEAQIQGLAKVASKRDRTNGTNLRAEIFNGLIDGACELERELRQRAVEKIDVHASSTLGPWVENIDLNLQRVLAYSAGHEAFEMQEVIDGGFDVGDTDDTDVIWVKMAELAGFFEPLGRIMVARGDKAAARAAQIQELIDLANFSDLTSVSWMTTLVTQQADATGPERIIDLLELELGIDIKG